MGGVYRVKGMCLAWSSFFSQEGSLLFFYPTNAVGSLSAGIALPIGASLFAAPAFHNSEI
jgi:hypothetical protein